MTPSKKIRVLYDVSFSADACGARDGVTGVGRVIENVARHLARSQEIELLITGCYGGDPHPALTSARARRYWQDSWQSHHVRFQEPVQSRTGWFARYGPALARSNAPGDTPLAPMNNLRRKGLNALARWDVRPCSLDGKADLFHSPFRPLPAAAFPGPCVQTVHDLFPLGDPTGSYNRWLIEEMLRGLQASRSWAVCVSEHTKRELCSSAGFPPERTLVSLLAADEVFHPRPDMANFLNVLARLKLPQAPYFLSVSNPQPRKNIPFLVRGFQEFAAADERHHLFLAGSRKLGWGLEELDRQLAAAPSSQSRIHFLGPVGDEDLATLYSHATAFVFPSLAEGFGLPPLEAMQCGAPVICSNTSSLPEVTGDAAISIPPHNDRSLVDALRAIATDKQLRIELSERGLRRAGQFSWSRTAAIVLEAYRMAARMDNS